MDALVGEQVATASHPDSWPWRSLETQSLHSVLVPAFLAMLIGDVLIWHASQTAS